jgi:hypothetical protein
MSFRGTGNDGAHMPQAAEWDSPMRGRVARAMVCP